MLMSAGVELPKGWAIGGWLLSGGEKMSKTSGNVVDPLDLIDDVGLDGFRYYVLSDTSYGNDGDFSIEGFTSRYNTDLANNLGNLVARVATVVAKKCDGIGTAPNPTSPLASVAATALADDDCPVGQRATEQGARGNVATRPRHERASRGERTVEGRTGPAVDAVMGDALEALRIVAVLASPAMPDTAQAIWERIGLPGQVSDQRLPDAAAWGQYPPGAAVTKGDALFPRLTA